MTIYICTHFQVQDYYVGVSLNDFHQSVQHLKRLWLVCTMLRRVKLPFRGTAHDYPKMILAQLLILQYWISIDHVTVDLMKHNMSHFNEEMGEISFSMLAQSVLGDSLRSDLEHMQKMFALLPIYRDVKRDLQLDAKKKNSISGRYQIKESNEDVLLVGSFFRRTIRNIVENKHSSYDGSPASYKNVASAAENTSDEVLPEVFDPAVCDLLPELLVKLEKGVNGTFLQKHPDLWPEAEQKNESELDSSMADLNVSMNSYQSRSSDGVPVYGAPWEGCQPGMMALATCDFAGSGLGIAVYRIVEVNPDQFVDGELVRSFLGNQLRCNKSNVDQACLRRGRWERVGSNNEEVMDWEIACFFAELTDARKLRSEQVAVVEELMLSKSVFQSQLRDAIFSDG